jgi:transposase
MPHIDSTPKRYIGFDIHKHYFVAIGVDPQLNPVFGPHQASIPQLAEWARKNLTPQDAVVVEMTTNTYLFFDIIKPLVHSVTVVHPPHVSLIVRAQVKTDKKAALTLAQLHASGLLPGIWIPPIEVRELRALVAHRNKMVRFSSIAKCRLHALLQRKGIEAPQGVEPFSPETRLWWDELDLTALEKHCMLSDLAMLDFARSQVKSDEQCLKQLAGRDERLPLLIQICGIGFITAITILAAIGEIQRFPTPEQLVGYAGLGARVHDSGMSRTTGRITKTGRRNLRRAMVDAANHAIPFHPHWRAVFERQSMHIGRQKTIVAIARKLLVAVWHVLSHQEADRFADHQQVATALFAYAHRVRVQNLPDEQSALQFTRNQLDRLKIGQEIRQIPWGSRKFRLPESKLTVS